MKGFRAIGSTRRTQSERPPQLVLRFAVLTAVCLGLGATAILGVTRHLHTVQAERTAAHHAGFVADALLSDALRPSDLARPVSGDRRHALDSLFRHKVLIDGTLLVTLQRADGLVTYSTDHTLIGKNGGDIGRIEDAIAGTITSRVSSFREWGGPRRSVKVLESTVPLAGTERRAGAVTLVQDYGPIAAAARSAFLPVAGILEAVLVALYLFLVPLLAKASQRIKRQMLRIEQQAYVDALTGLPNRARFRELAAHALERRQPDEPLAVMLLDLDRFQDINDTLGHQRGDELLHAVAQRLQDLLPESVTLARLGGDEFALLADVADAEQALTIATHLQEGMREPFLIEDVPLAVEASIGITVFPAHGDDVETLLRRADISMYEAKQRRVAIFVCQVEADKADLGRLVLLGNLRRALDEHQLVLHYQPKADATGAIVGAEALVRWEHPQQGLIQPVAFVPHAERTGMGRLLSRYVFDQSLRQLSEWTDEGIQLPVAVNLSMYDLLDRTLPGDIESALKRERINPRLLELEITESAIMTDPENATNILRRLSDTGVTITIDDFGTGHSSLNYLKVLPVDVIKIDKAFVTGMADEAGDRAIVRATIGLAHELGRLVVAEGVETEDLWNQLVALRCDIMQGYHIARPQTPTDLALFLRGKSLRTQPTSRTPGKTAAKRGRTRKPLADAA
jgi:diguanylate cyclase (GGDEF)-like protein